MDNYANAHISVDYDRHEITNGTGEPIKLTPTQWRIITLFIENTGRLLSNIDIQACCRAGQKVVESTVKGHISVMRRQLGSAFAIETISGYGYKYDGAMSKNNNALMVLTDDRLIELYRLWSEENWAASFMSPSEDIVKRFREWLFLRRANEVHWEPYENEMLVEYHRQAAEA